MANRKTEALYYLCACGCKVKPEDIVKIRGSVDGVQLNRRGCPKHRKLGLGAVVVDNVLRCELCGELFGGRKAHYCPACRPEHKRATMRAYSKRYIKGEVKNTKPHRMIDGKRDHAYCGRFSGEICGKICIEPEFYCRARQSKKMNIAA